MDPEVARVVVDVNPKCPGSYQKVKKLIGEIPQITDPVFDEKKNKVTFCCSSSEEITDKLWDAAKDAIKSIGLSKGAWSMLPVGQRPPTADKPRDSGKPPEATEVKPKKRKKPKEAGTSKEATKESGSRSKSTKVKTKESEKPKEAGPPKEATKKSGSRSKS